MKNAHILYFDKDTFFCEQVKTRLEWKGYEVTTIDNEHDFLTKIGYQNYELIIVNILESSPTPFPLLESLKRLSTLPVIIAVGVDPNYHQVINAMKLGCVDYIIKSPITQNFIDKISYSIFQQSEALRQQKIITNRQRNTIDKKVETPSSYLSSWEYNISKNRVQWSFLPNKIEITQTYDEFIEKIHQEDIALVKAQNNICLFSKKPVEYMFRFISDNDRESAFYAQIKAEVGSNGIVNKLFGQMRACSTQQMNHQHLQLKLSFVDNTTDAFFITDARKQIVSINNTFTLMTGYSEQEILNKKITVLDTNKFDSSLFKIISSELKTKDFWQGEVFIRHRKGHSIPVWQSTYVLKDSEGNFSQSLSIIKDISQQKYFEESIKFQANYDPLTQLPNRSLFLDRLASSIKLCKRNNSKLALLLLDLNKFKYINDSLGHHAGDILLQETSRILLASVRNSDTVARLGGDEFSIILPEIKKTTDAEIIASKIFNAFKKAIFIDQQEIFISASIGITIFPNDGDKIETLQKNADRAMYIAKKKDDNSFYYFTQSLQEETEKRLKLIGDMRSAIINQEFTLHYQPIVDIITNKIVSAETLLRWKHPESGYIEVNYFIQIAEESGLIREIGNWVIEEVATHIQRWSDMEFPPLPISLNQSVAQYSIPECHIEWLDILAKKKIPPCNITFEISEKIFLEEKINSLKSIEKLKQAGIQISLDSFGTGYSSLSYLKKFPVDVIKIDRSFIHSMQDNPSNAILVETIIFLANKLKIKVIATGVENKKQLSLLSHQCRFAQGHYFSKPLSVAEFEVFIQQHNLH